MQQIPDWYFAIIFFSSFLGFIVSAILFFINQNASFPSRLLSGFLTCLSILALNYGLMVTSFYLSFLFYGGLLPGLLLVSGHCVMYM